MQDEWRVWFDRYDDGMLSLMELGSYLIPLLDQTNVKEALDALPQPVLDRFRDWVWEVDPWKVICTDWSEESVMRAAETGVVAMQEYFRQR